MAQSTVANIKCDKGPEFLEMAVLCKFITKEEMQEILPQIIAYSKKNPKVLLAQFFLEKKVLSKDKIQLLFSIKNHIEMLMADRQFAKLGVVNEFVSPDKVKEALKVQIKIFRKNKTSVKIGDILLKSQDISSEDNTALLLTQDRIPDEFLAETLYNTIAKTELEQMEIEQRFGAIAVKKKHITAGQLNTALKYQKRKFKEEKQKRYLGDILKELFELSDKDIISILKIQKKLEAKRMKLEEKLIQYNAHQKLKKHKFEPFFKYHVTEDKYTAYVQKKKKPDTKINLSDFLKWVSLNGIKFGYSDSKDIQAFLDREDYEEKFKIAQGIRAQPFREETVEFMFDTQFFDKKVSDKDNDTEPPKVSVNDVLATISPYQEATPGTDVLGRPVHLPQQTSVILICGEGVVRKGDQFLASVSGIPKLHKNKLSVSSQVKKSSQAANKPKVESTPQKKDVSKSKDNPNTKVINGDITADTMDKYTSCNLRVTGNISPGVLVTCRNIIIEGEVLGDLSVSGNVEVKGNIVSMADPAEGKALIVQITSNGLIQVGGNIVKAKIFAGNGLRLPKGDLISSNVSTCGDIVVKNILSNSKAPSKVRITRRNILVKAELKKLDISIKKISGELDKLLQDDELKDLTKDLIKKEQAQKKYQEKQVVLSYLNSVLENNELEEMVDLEKKISVFEEKNKETETVDIRRTIDGSETAQKYIEFAINRIKGLELKAQESMIRELQDCAMGMCNIVDRTIEKLNKKFQKASKGCEEEIKKEGLKMDQLNKELANHKKKRMSLIEQQKQVNANSEPLIKVKNQVESSTIIMGEKAKIVVDKTIYGVTFKEGVKKSNKKAEIIVSGYFE